jgi:hypothetical protein
VHAIVAPGTKGAVSLVEEDGDDVAPVVRGRQVRLAVRVQVADRNAQGTG